MGSASAKMEARHGVMREFNRYDMDATNFQTMHPHAPTGPPWSEARFRSTWDSVTGEELENFADVRQMQEPLLGEVRPLT